jgi:hypothetical protein
MSRLGHAVRDGVALAVVGLAVSMLLAWPLAVRALASTGDLQVELYTGEEKSWSLVGEVEFVVGEYGDSLFYCGGDWFEIQPGDVVSIVFNDSTLWGGYGDIWLDGLQDLYIDDLYVDKLYINGVQVCSGDRTSIYTIVEPGSFNSSLQLTVGPELDWVDLTVNDETVLYGVNDSVILVSGITPSPDTGELYIDLGARSLWGNAGDVVVNGVEVPAVTPEGLGLLAIAGTASAALLARRRRPH